MTRKFLVPLGLVGLSSDPTGSSAGQTYYNTTANKIRVYNGTDWEDSGLSTQEVADAIAGAALSSTDDLTEGAANLYFSEERVVTALDSGSLQSISLGGAGDFTINSDANLIINTGTGSTAYLESSTSGNEIITTSALDSAIAAATLQGVQGIQGETGTQGIQGETGTQGIISSASAPSIQNVLWLDTTADAQTGPQGIQGEQGLQGTQGVQGIQGEIGTQGVQGTAGQATVYRWTKAADGGETSLSGEDDSAIDLEYTVGQELLHINGILQVRGVDYVATTGTTITDISPALILGDIIDIWAPNAFNVADTYTQTQSAALFGGTSDQIILGSQIFG